MVISVIFRLDPSSTDGHASVTFTMKWVPKRKKAGASLLLALRLGIPPPSNLFVWSELPLQSLFDFGENPFRHQVV